MAAVTRPLLTWASRRLALLLTYAYDGDTHDVPEYRAPWTRPSVAGRLGPVPAAAPAVPLYRAAPAAVWDGVAIAMPLWHWVRCGDGGGDGDGGNGDGGNDGGDERAEADPAAEAASTAAVGAFTAHVVGHMQGDTLPMRYKECVARAHVRPHHPAWFRRRRPRAHAPRAMDLLQECAGQSYAARAHAEATRRLRDVVAADPVDPSLVAACASYFATQKRLPDPVRHVRWVPRWNAYAVDDPATRTRVFAHAVRAYCAARWPAGGHLGAPEDGGGDGDGDA